MDFKLNASVDKNKVFVLNRSEIEKRLDPFYYIPELSTLENAVKNHNPKPLRNYTRYQSLLAAEQHLQKPNRG